MDTALIFAEEVPSQDKVINKIADNSAVHAQMAFVNTKNDVDDPKGLNFATIYAIGSTVVRRDLVVKEFRVTPNEIFTDT